MKVYFNFKKFKENLLNIFFPKDIKCLICGRELDTNTLYCICDSCMEELPFNTGKTCLRCDSAISSDANYCVNCKNSAPQYKRNKSVFLYDGVVKKFVRQLKFDNKKFYASTLSNFIASEYVKLNKDFDIIIPVPIHKDREKRRGYNQATLLCTSLKEKLKLNVDENVLTKERATRSQAYLSREEREKNLEDAFKVVDRKLVKGKTILLVDDVFTTGTTINECAKTLRLCKNSKSIYQLFGFLLFL